MREICTSGLRRGRERGGHWLCLISCVPLYSTLISPLFRALRRGRLVFWPQRNNGESNDDSD